MKHHLAVVALLATSALSGCAFNETIALDGQKYNETVEKAANAQVLTNILRARDRRPMHFTAFTQLRGSYSVSSNAGLSLEIPFGGDAARIFPLSPSVNLEGSSGPSFDVAILDNEEFTRGILQPIDLETLEYYWQQGWTQDLLLHLFIHKVEVEGADKPIKNTPLIQTQFKEFQVWVDEMQDKSVIVGTKTTGRAIGPILDQSLLVDMKKFVEAEKEGLRLVKMSDAKGSTEATYQLCKVENVAGICLKECKPKALQDACKQKSVKEDPYLTPELGATKARGLASFQIGTKRYKIHLRSSQGVLYYLGEVMRAQERPGASEIEIKYGLPEKGGDASTRDKIPLFVLGKTTDSDRVEGPLGVRYDGDAYAIPKRDDNWMSKNALTIATQLLGLHKKSEELPTTEAVQFVGQ